MAIVKEFKVRRWGRYDYDANTLLAFEPNGDKVWIKEEAYDATTLAPLFTTASGTALTQKNLNAYHGMTHGTVLSKYPIAFSGLGEMDNPATNEKGASSLLYSDPSNRYNMDKSTQHGNIIEFTSTQGVKHHLIWYVKPDPNHQTASMIDPNGHGSSIHHTTYYTLVEGDDWTNPVATTSGTLSGYNYTSFTNYDYYQVIPLAVDTVNKFIYCHQVLALNNSSNVYASAACYTRSIGIVCVPFTTRLDGSLAVSSPTINVYNNIAQSWHSIDSNPTFYCGKNNDGTAMFMTQIENETYITSIVTTNSNGTTSSTTVNQFATAKTLWTAVKSNSAPKIYFDKLVAGVKTNVASINSSSNQFSSAGASKPMYFFAPSKFEASTASGETNIYYSYSLCFDTSSVPSIIYYRWDKATPTASANLCTINWNGATSTDKIAYAFPSAVATGSYLTHQTVAHCFVTTIGSDRYLNVLHTHGNATAVTAKTLAGQKTLTTFQIDTTTWQSLTYIGSISLSAYSYCSLNDSNSRIAVIVSEGMAVYTCTAGTWSLTSSESGAINVVARDYNDRIWALDIGSADYTLNSTTSPYMFSSSSWYETPVKLRLHSSSLPNLATVEFVTRDQTYTGSNLTNQLKVNAYDTSSQRVSTSVTLTLVGSNAYFTSNSSTSITVTTSASADTLVGVTLTGSGLVQVTSSFAL